MGAKLADLNTFAYSQYQNVPAWTACAQGRVMKSIVDNRDAHLHVAWGNCSVYDADQARGNL